jgi:hypothetical protein
MKSSTVIKTSIRFLCICIGALIAMLPEYAFAQNPTIQGMATGSGCDNPGTIGNAVCNVVGSFALVPGLLTGIAYLFGIILGALGIAKIYEHVQEPRQTSIWEGLKKFLAGGGFFALPIVMEAARNTLTGNDPTGLQVSNFHVGGVTGGGLDAMVVALVADLWTPVEYLLGGFGYIAGIILIMIGIARMLKTAQEGPRGPGGIGTIMTFITGGALFSLSRMMGAWTSSLFNNGANVANDAQMSFTGGLQPQEIAHVHSVISAVLGFMMMIGWISFIRGWFILRDVAEGSHQASMMAAMTHLFGGALAINLGGVIDAVETTFGLTGYGIAFTVN